MQTMKLTDPALFQKFLGEFILLAYGEAAVPADKLAWYQQACQQAAAQQANEMGGTFKDAIAQVVSGVGTPPHVTGYATLLENILGRDFFTRDVKNEALALQAYGRIIHTLDDTLDISKMAAPKIDSTRDPKVLVDAQLAFQGVLARRRIDIEYLNTGTDRRALNTAWQGLVGLSNKYKNAAGDLGRGLNDLVTKSVELAKRYPNPRSGTPLTPPKI